MADSRKWRGVFMAVACTGAVLLGGAAQATSGLRFLRDSPLSKFTEEDFELLRQAAVVVLESTVSRKSETWSNDATGNSGKVTSLRRFTAADGRACKRLRLDNRSPEFSGSWDVTVCKSPDGDWKIDPNAKP